MDRDPFDDFAARYDLMGEEGAGRHEFLRALVTRYGIRRALDCACGTGSDLIELTALGVEVYGSDISTAMLARARAKLAEVGAETHLEQADFRALSDHFDERFDCVLCLSTSLPQLLDETDILKALRSMRSVLNDGGVLVLSQGMTDRQAVQKPRFVPVVDRPEHTRIMAIDYHDAEWEVHVLDLIRSGGEPGFHVDSFRYRLLLRDDYERLLREAGYSTLEYLGAWDFRPYDKHSSDRLIVLARP